MDNKLVTLAIHSFEKATILKNILESNGIIVYLEKVEEAITASPVPVGFYVKINTSDLSKSLSIIEEHKLFSYDNKDTYKIDDGRKRILVAVDFSSYSMKACQVAFNLAKEVNAKVKILHIYYNLYFPSHIPFADQLKDENDESLLDKSRRQMLNFCFEIDKKISEGEWPSVNYSYSLREGLVDEEIENFSLEYKPSLLVLGTKGKDNNESSILGNVTADVIEIVNVPVLAVPESSPINSISDIKHIVFLTNLQSRDLESFNTLVEIATLYTDIKITLLHINRINGKGDRWTEAELAGMKEYFKKMYPQLNIEYKLIDSPDIPGAVRNYVEHENVTIVCMNTRRRNFLGRIFSPSISRKVLSTTSDKAILVLRG